MSSNSGSSSGDVTPDAAALRALRNGDSNSDAEAQSEDDIEAKVNAVLEVLRLASESDATTRRRQLVAVRSLMDFLEELDGHKETELALTVAVRGGVFNHILRLLQQAGDSVDIYGDSGDTEIKYHLWKAMVLISMRRPDGMSHLVELTADYLLLAQRDVFTPGRPRSWASTESKSASRKFKERGFCGFPDPFVRIFLRPTAHIHAFLPPLCKHVLQNAQVLHFVLQRRGAGTVVQMLAQAARVAKDWKMLTLIRDCLNDFPDLALAVQRSPSTGEVWDLAVLEVFGAIEKHTLVNMLINDVQILDGYLLKACNLALESMTSEPDEYDPDRGERGHDPVRQDLFVFSDLEMMVSISSVDSRAHMMVKSGYLDICVRAITTVAPNISSLLDTEFASILDPSQGHAACLEVMGNIARIDDLRPKVLEALAGITEPHSAHDLLQRFRSGKDGRVRAASQRLLFELGWLSDSLTSADGESSMLARGAEAEAIYRQALQDGEGRVKSMKMVLLGEDRSGKSSLLASVSGAGFEPKMESTHGVATAHFKLPREGNWKHEQGGMTAAEAAAAAVARQLLAQTQSSSAAPHGLPAQSDERSQPDQLASAARPAADHHAQMSKAEEGTEKSEAGKRVRRRKEKEEEVGEAAAGATDASDLPFDLIELALGEDDKSTRVVAKDTAGQPRYHSMLARTLSASSIPIIVFSLERWAKTVVKHDAFAELDLNMDLNCTSRAGSSQDEESTLGHEERLFHYWLSMVQVRTRDTFALIAGTHFDKVVSVLHSDKAAIKELLQSINDRILLLLEQTGKTAVNRIIPCETSDLLFFPVDNSRSVPDNGVDEMQAAIRDAVYEAQSTGPLSQNVPLKWMRLLDALKATGRPCMSISDVCAIAEHFTLFSAASTQSEAVEAEVRLALKFLHDIGEVLYFAEAGGLCSMLVFVDPEFLALAESNVLDCPRAVKSMTDKCKLLHDSAVLDEALLPVLWKNLLKLDAKAQPRTSHEPVDFQQVMLEFLIADGFLVALQQAAPCAARGEEQLSSPGRRFLVPSLLKRWSPSDAGAVSSPSSLDALCSASPPPTEAALYMDLRGFSLPELFPQLLSRLLAHPAFTGDFKMLFRNAIEIWLPDCLVSILEVPVDRPTAVLAHVSHAASASVETQVLQMLVQVLEEAGRGWSAQLGQQVVVGPRVQRPDGTSAVASLRELLRSADVEGVLRCTQLPGIISLEGTLPAWVARLLPSDGKEKARSPREDGPERNAMTVEQLSGVGQQAATDFPKVAKKMTMYDVNDRIIKPMCAKHNRPYARILNDRGLLVQVFITHAWKENFAEFVRSVQACFAHEPDKPTVWICAFALHQSTSKAAISAQLGGDPAEAPFTAALKRAERYLIVRNKAVDIFSRVWCCWELFCAQKFGMLDPGSGKFLITGPCCFACTGNEDVAKAEASEAEDKRKILNAITREEVYHMINNRIRQIKSFTVDKVVGTQSDLNSAGMASLPPGPQPVVPAEDAPASQLPEHRLATDVSPAPVGAGRAHHVSEAKSFKCCVLL